MKAKKFQQEGVGELSWPPTDINNPLEKINLVDKDKYFSNWLFDTSVEKLIAQ